MGCVHKHHASFLRLAVCDGKSFIMCTCSSQTENARYSLSNNNLKMICEKDLLVFSCDSPLCRWAWFPLLFFNTLASCQADGGQLISSLEGTPAFNIAHILDTFFFFSLPQTCCIFFFWLFSPCSFFTLFASSDGFIQPRTAQTAEAEVLVSKLHKTMSGSACDDDFHHTLWIERLNQIRFPTILHHPPLH